MTHDPDDRLDPADDDLAARFEGVDGPRPVPEALHGHLEALLTGSDAVGALARGDVDGARPVPPMTGERLRVAMAEGASIHAALPGARRLRLVGGGRPRVLQAVAVAAAVILVLGTVAVGAELTARWSGGGGLDLAGPPPAGGRADGAALVSVRSCEALLDYFRTNARALVDAGQAGGWGNQQAMVLDQGGGVSVATGAPVAATGGAARSSAEGSAAPPPSVVPQPAAGVDASGTNVQEAGVDEPDIVKVEPTRVFTITPGPRGPVIRSLRPTETGAQLLGTFDLPADAGGAQLLLAGDRLLALATVWSPETRAQWTKLWSIDVSDPARLRLAATTAVEGVYTTARLVDGLVRVVIASQPVGPPVVFPSDATPEAAAQAKAANERNVEASTLDDWVPNYELTTYRAGKAATTTGRLCQCEDTLRPAEFSGFGTVSVLTIDPEDPTPDNVASVTGAAGITYASPTDLYVASVDYPSLRPVAAIGGREPAPAPAFSPVEPGSAPPPFPAPPGRTSIHQFSIAEPEARYVASGSVPGTLLSQFSMSQRRGDLRVASTTTNADREGGVDNLVSVLRPEGGELKVVGQVHGLGAPGERIQGVRMIDDTGYVVTFRQVDPLYVLDLADPTAPRVRGELKIPGVSTYLHPMDGGYLIGLGAEVTEQGRRTGVGMSVFDVRDKAAPSRTAHALLGNGYSPAERDHLAFLYWARTSTVVVPYQGMAPTGDGQLDLSAVVLRVTPAAITEVGRVTHTGRPGPAGAGGPALDRGGYGPAAVERSAVVGDTLWTFSNAGVLVNDLRSLAERGWLAYPG